MPQIAHDRIGMPLMVLRPCCMPGASWQGLVSTVGGMTLCTDATKGQVRLPKRRHEVISGNVTTDSQIVVRLPIKVDQETSKKSEKLLFFLTTNNDNATYGPYHYEQGFIDLTTEQATFADQKSTLVVFLNKNLTSADFLDEVKQKIKK